MPTPHIHNFVISGGPCGGKSTGMSRVSERLSALGYQVIIIACMIASQSRPQIFGKHVWDVDLAKEFLRRWRSCREKNFDFKTWSPDAMTRNPRPPFSLFRPDIVTACEDVFYAPDTTEGTWAFKKLFHETHSQVMNSKDMDWKLKNAAAMDRIRRPREMADGKTWRNTLTNSHLAASNVSSRRPDVPVGKSLAEALHIQLQLPSEKTPEALQWWKNLIDKTTNYPSLASENLFSYHTGLVSHAATLPGFPMEILENIIARQI